MSVHEMPPETLFRSGRLVLVKPEQRFSVDLRDKSTDNRLDEFVQELFNIDNSAYTTSCPADTMTNEELAEVLFGTSPKQEREPVDLNLFNNELLDINPLPNIHRSESGLKRRKIWQRKSKYDMRIIADTEPQKPENLVTSGIKRIVANRPRRSASKEFSLALRIGKGVNDASKLVKGKLNQAVEHPHRNKVIAGVATLAVGYLLLKNIDIVDHDSSAVAFNDTPDNTPDFLDITTPKSHHSRGNKGGLFDQFNYEPEMSDATSDLGDVIKSPAPEVISPQIPTTEITIAPGGSMWSALESQGFEGRQIVDMLHNYADQQGVSYGSLSQVDIGQTFVLEVI